MTENRRLCGLVSSAAWLVMIPKCRVRYKLPIFLSKVRNYGVLSILTEKSNLCHFSEFIFFNAQFSRHFFIISFSRLFIFFYLINISYIYIYIFDIPSAQFLFSNSKCLPIIHILTTMKIIEENA